MRRRSATATRAAAAGLALALLLPRSASSTPGVAYKGCGDMTSQLYPGCEGYDVGYFEAVLMDDPNALMTNRICAAMAIARGYSTWGTEDGSVCMAGLNWKDEYVLAELSFTDKCTTTCSGEYPQKNTSVLDSDICGGPCVASLFTTTNLKVLPELPTVNATHVGCYKDCPDHLYVGAEYELGKIRMLPIALLENSSFMSVELCTQLAGNLGFELAGAQGSSCFAGNNLELAMTLGQGQCTLPCPAGSSVELCGGPCVNSIYRVNPLPVLDSATAAPSVSQTDSPAAIFPTVAPIIDYYQKYEDSTSYAPTTLDTTPTSDDSSSSSGVVVGILVVLSLSSGVFVFWRWRVRRRQVDYQHHGIGEDFEDNGFEMSARPRRDFGRVGEI